MTAHDKNETTNMVNQETHLDDEQIAGLAQHGAGLIPETKRSAWLHVAECPECYLALVHVRAAIGGAIPVGEDAIPELTLDASAIWRKAHQRSAAAAVRAQEQLRIALQWRGRVLEPAALGGAITGVGWRQSGPRGGGVVDYRGSETLVREDIFLEGYRLEIEVTSASSTELPRRALLRTTVHPPSDVQPVDEGLALSLFSMVGGRGSLLQELPAWGKEVKMPFEASGELELRLTRAGGAVIGSVVFTVLPDGAVQGG